MQAPHQLAERAMDGTRPRLGEPRARGTWRSAAHRAFRAAAGRGRARCAGQTPDAGAGRGRGPGPEGEHPSAWPCQCQHGIDDSPHGSGSPQSEHGTRVSCPARTQGQPAVAQSLQLQQHHRPSPPGGPLSCGTHNYAAVQQKPLLGVPQVPGLLKLPRCTWWGLGALGRGPVTEPGLPGTAAHCSLPASRRKVNSHALQYVYMQRNSKACMHGLPYASASRFSSSSGTGPAEPGVGNPESSLPPRGASHH